VVQAALLCRAGERGQPERFRVRYERKVLFVSEVLETEYSVRYVQVNPRRWYWVTRSESLREFRNDGRSADKRTSSSESDPYVWRIYTISRYEKRDGGVYVEQENIVLSRPIPSSVEWLVGPAVRRLAKEVVRMSLRETRDAVRANVESHVAKVGLPPSSGLSTAELAVTPVDRTE
jgi:hypothetical protein